MDQDENLPTDVFVILLSTMNLALNHARAIFGESTYLHDFMLEVSKGSYKGACHDTVRGLVSVLSDLGQDQCRLFVSTCLRGGTKL